MKKLYLSLLLIATAVVFLFSFTTADEKPWFDMEHCGFCKILTEYEGLLDNMTWEHYEISNGIVSISAVKDDYREAFDEVGIRMKEVGERVMKGEEVPLCGMCTAMGHFFARGVKYEQVKTKNGDFTIMTSDNPEVVEEMKKWARRTNEEMEKFLAAKKKE
ncbi:MAG: hypothetical protein JXA92_14385 [candidate division Zixibacteria bacterium]|nr:hypothetical protein [candidate division Zixibacteria bacterium]